MLCRIERNYEREGSGPGSRFEGRLLEDVQAEVMLRRAEPHIRAAIYAELGNDHYVIFTEDRWTVEHSVECKLSGHMHECDYHEAVSRIAAEFDPDMEGRWLITAIDGNGEPALVRDDLIGDQK